MYSWLALLAWGGFGEVDDLRRGLGDGRSRQGVEGVVHSVLNAGEQVPVAIEDRHDRRVPGTNCDLLRARTGCDPEGYGAVPEIMQTQRLQPSAGDGRLPEAAPEQDIVTLADEIHPQYRALVIVGAYCGLRSGEMFALRPERVDLLHAWLTVAEPLVEVSGHHTFGPPKTRAGRRAVPMPRIVVSELERHLAEYPGRELVFAAPQGGPVRTSSAGSRERISVRSIFGSGTRANGLEGMRPASTAARMIFRRSGPP